jgi:hypothetical protein
VTSGNTDNPHIAFVTESLADILRAEQYDEAVQLVYHIDDTFFTAPKANVRATLILECTDSRHVETLLNALEFCVRPLLEYANCI